MMTRRLTTYCLLLACLFLVGCDKGEGYTRSPRENFEALWKIMDENYCFFEFKDIDWDEVHDRYSVQITDTMNQYDLFKVLGKMLNEVKDGHTNLVSSFNISRYWAWYEDYPANFSTEVQKKYLGSATDNDFQQAAGISYRTLADGQVGYMYYSSFSSGVGETNIDHILLLFKDCKGLIIDVRDNGGGSLTYSDLIASRFLEEKILAGYLQHKTGKGHNDFSEPYPTYLTPSEHIRWFRPVVVLTNRHCFSAANDFVQKMNLMPQVVTIGDRTGGGSGFPFSSELPNGWGVRFSAGPMLDTKMQHTEFGIDPDIRVDMTAEDISKGKDTIIEAGIANILSRSKDNNPPKEN